MKKFIVEYNILGRTESYVFEGKDEQDVRSQAAEKNKKINGFINKVYKAID